MKRKINYRKSLNEVQISTSKALITVDHLEKVEKTPNILLKSNSEDGVQMQ